jgi:hypothetical protein
MNNNNDNYIINNLALPLYVTDNKDEIIYWSGTAIRNPYNRENEIIVEGTVGYHYDKVKVKFCYDLVEKKINVDSTYKLLHCENKELIKMCVMTPASDGSLITLKQCVPYFRFPISEKGIEVPKLVKEIFKVFPSKKYEDFVKPLIFFNSEHRR